MEAYSHHQQLASLVLKEYRKLKRGSYRVKEALGRVKHADKNSFDRIILEQGETVWRAYFAAKRAAESKRAFRGKDAMMHLLKKLSTEPIQNHRVFAKELAAFVMSHDQPSEESDTPLSESNRINRIKTGAKRRRAAATDGYAISIVMPNDATSIPEARDSHPQPKHNTLSDNLHGDLQALPVSSETPPT